MNKKSANALKSRHLIGYALGDFGCCVTFFTMTNFLTRYYITVPMIDTAILAVMTLLWKVWDAISSPVFGMLMDKHFATRPVSDQVGSSRLGFADEEYLEKFLDITPGSVSVMGLMNDKENRVQLLMDEDILKGEYFGCHPCINTTSLRIRTKDLTEKILPAMGHAPKVVHLD